MPLPTHHSSATQPPVIGALFIEPESPKEILDDFLIRDSDHHDQRTSQLSPAACPVALLRSVAQMPAGNSPSTLSDSSVAWVVQAPGFKFPPFGKFAMKYNPFGQIHVNMTDQEIADWAEKQKEDTIEAIRQYPSSGLLSAVLGMKIAGGAEKKVAFAFLENGDIASPGIVPQIVSRGSTEITRGFSDFHQSFGITTGNTNVGSISVPQFADTPRHLCQGGRRRSEARPVQITLRRRV